MGSVAEDGSGSTPEWAAARDGDGNAADWDGRMAAQCHEAATHGRGVGETSFPWGFDFFFKERRMQ
jgi:hypothetical protein